MVFIIPRKRTSYTRIKYLSKYDDISTTKHFRLQKRKSETSRPLFRIVTNGFHPYYEIAYGNDLNQMQQREWRYVTEDIPKIMPADLQKDDDKMTKTRIEWILAHFTCKAVEVDRAEVDDANSVIRHLNHIEAQRKSSDHKDHTHVAAAGAAAATGAAASSSSSSAASAPALATPLAAEKKAAKKPGGLKRGDSLVPTTIWPLRGLVPFILAMLATNLPALLLREADPMVFIIALFCLNIVLFIFVIRNVPAVLGITVLMPEQGVNPQLMYRPPCACTGPTAAAKSLRVRNTASDFSSDEESEEDPDETEDDASPAVRAAVSSEPVAPADEEGVSSAVFGEEDLKNLAAPVSAKGILPVSSIVEAKSSSDTNAYCDPQGESWQVRCGPNYAKNKLKAYSRKSLFHLLGVDVFRCGKKVHHIARHLDLGSLQKRKPAGYVSAGGSMDQQYTDSMKEWNDVGGSGHESIIGNVAAGAKAADDREPVPDITGAPDGFHLGTMENKLIWVLNFQMPSYAPSMLSKQDDGDGMTMVWYLIATDSTQQDLLRPSPVSAAIHLLKRFMCADPKGEEGAKMLQRMKALPRLVNDDAFDVNMFIRKTIQQYNGKPFLTRPQHTVHRGPGYFEFDLDIHNFCFTARKVLHTFLDKLDKVVLDWGFTIEAFGDEEQPECVLGAFRLFKCNPHTKPSWEATMRALKRAKSAPASAASTAEEKDGHDGLASASGSGPGSGPGALNIGAPLSSGAPQLSSPASSGGGHGQGMYVNVNGSPLNLPAPSVSSTAGPSTYMNTRSKVSAPGSPIASPKEGSGGPGGINPHLSPAAAAGGMGMRRDHAND